MTSEPPARRPRLTEDLSADVVVVGGGLTGLATAHELRSEGADVIVLEADRMASGSTGFTTAKVTSLHGLPYADLIRRHGERLARQYADANQWAVERVCELVEAERRDAITYTTDPARRDEIEADVAAAQRLGLPADLVTDTDLPFAIKAGVRFANQAQIHPRRVANELARNLRVFEQTRVHGLHEKDGDVIVEAAHATVRAKHAVVATLLPFDDAGGFFAKTAPMRSYAMAVRIAGSAPTAMCIGIDSPTRSVRPLRFDDGDVGLVIGGNGHRVGEEPDTQQQYDDLERWAMSTFEVTAIEARWSAQDYKPADGVPYIGRSPRRDHVYVATGFQKWGMTTAFVAASIISDDLAGRESPWHEVFDATRAVPRRSLRELVRSNATIVKPFVEGHLHKTRRCTHLGCITRWNEAEQSWDCPCHGSRFAADGEVLEGPATDPVSLGEHEETYS